MNKHEKRQVEIAGAQILYRISELYESGVPFDLAKRKAIDEFDFQSVPYSLRAMAREVAWGFGFADLDSEAHEAFIDHTFNTNIRPHCKWPRLSRFLWPLTGIWI